MRSRSVLVAGLLVVGAACDTGDGTTLREPDGGTAPVSTVPIGTVDTAPADEIVAGGEGPATLPTVLLDTEPLPPDPDAPTLPAPQPVGRFIVNAPWEDGAPIDVRYGCDGRNAAPPMTWSDLPGGTAELAVALVDESDLSRGQPFVHWVMTGIDPSRPGLREDETPTGAVLALNFFGNVAYDGPCPAPGTTSVYTLTVYALDQQLEFADGTPAADVLDTIRQVTLGLAAVTGSSTR